MTPNFPASTPRRLLPPLATRPPRLLPWVEGCEVRMRIGGAACHRPAAAAVMERRHRQHEFDRRRPQLADRSLGCSGWFCWTLPSANLREQNLPLLLTSLATLNVQRGLAAGTTKRQVDVALGRPKETNGMVWRSDLTRRWHEIP